MPIVVAAGAQLISESLIANGAIDPGETVAIAFSLANTGVVDTADLGATLLASGGVTAPNPASNYFGRLVAGGPPVARTFTFTASPSASGSIIASLHLQDGTNDFGIVPFMFGLPSAVTLANTNAIIIPDHGPGLPYPAAITISGMTGIVSKATVTLNGFTHSFASDVNVLLVSPSGHSALLMSHAGGFYGVTNLTLTFDDAAAAPIASSTRLVSGSYKPAGYGGIPNFPSSAPADPYGTLLSAVNGTDPNGAWSLYVMDDRIGDSGVIAAGWTLNLTIIEPVNPIADLALGLSGSPASLFTASALTYTISVTNLGPNSAPGIVVADTLPPGLQIVSTTSSQGAASLSSNLLTCNLGSLNVNGTATVTIVGVPIIGGTFLNSAGVSGAVSDANLVNNSGFTSTLVTVPIAASLHGVIRTNQFQLSIIAQPGMSYDVQSSTDLKTWSSLGVYAAPPNGVITVLDPLGTTSRFYRAVRQVP
jgi:uncharacterized repeat protein (TIGR01451 family)